MRQPAFFQHTCWFLAANRFCKYPQELVLRLERPSKVQQIQILAHEYKVRQLR